MYTCTLAIMVFLINFNPSGRPRAKAGEEPGQLGYLRSKLLHFLQSSRHYEAESLISRFPGDGKSRDYHAPNT